MASSLLEALNAVLLDSRGELQRYLESADSAQVDKEIHTFKGIIQHIAYTSPGIMLETIDYLIKHPDSELFKLVMPELLNSYVLYNEKELPEGTAVLLERALKYGYRDRYFITGRFFNSLSVTGKVSALKMLSRYSTAQQYFLLSKEILNIEYEVYKKVSPVINKLEPCLPRFEFDDQSMKALVMHVFGANGSSLKNYLSRILPYIKRCRDCYTGVFNCNGRIYHLSDFNPPEVCPDGK